MKLSRKSDYALRALVSLAERSDANPVSVRKLAAENDVPRRFLEQIMLELKSRGWVRSVAGRDGGFLLAQPPEAISMGAVVRHFDGILAPIACVSTAGYEPCTQEPRCRFRRVLLRIRNETTRLMDATDLASLCGNAPVATSEVFAAEFVHGAGI